MAETPAHPHVARSPEARREDALLWAQGLGEATLRRGLVRRLLLVLRRTALGVWDDGFIHAGNLAYMTIFALFPFFIVVGAMLSLIGAGERGAGSIEAFLSSLPPVVRHVVAPVAMASMTARHGWVLWAGGLIGLWTVSSLIETIRDILRRAYGVHYAEGAAPSFWKYRLGSTAVIMLAVALLIFTLYLQVAMTALEVLISAHLRHVRLPLAGLLWSRLLPAGAVFGSVWLLFAALNPSAYRWGYPRWPGAAVVTLWWGMVSLALPWLLRSVFKYDLTYGSLAGVMITLFFFWLVGLGLVIGAELNASLAVTPEERDMLRSPIGRARESG